MKKALISEKKKQNLINNPYDYFKLHPKNCKKEKRNSKILSYNSKLNNKQAKGAKKRTLKRNNSKSKTGMIKTLRLDKRSYVNNTL